MNEKEDKIHKDIINWYPGHMAKTRREIIENLKENKKWVSYFENKGIPAVLVDANSGKGIDNVIKKIEKAMEEKKEQEMQKGRIGKKIRAMILRNTECWKIFFYK